MFKIISDGGCDFTRGDAKKLDVNIVPFYVSFDQQNYLKEGIDISKEAFFKKLSDEKGLYPKTSQPSPQDYVDAFTAHLQNGDDLLVLTISSRLSGSHNSATLAAGIVKEEYPDREVVVIDSMCVTIGQGLILREIVKMQAAGYSLQETARITGEICKTAKVYFTLDTLEYLKRGGRVGAATALVGGILGINPILQLEEGKVTQLGKVRGRKKALALIEKIVMDALESEANQSGICVGHIQSEKDAKAFKADVETVLGVRISNQIAEIGATIGSHVGPGALGFAHCKKYEYVV
ncbi:MAG: DegV family protein [Defluviitaleaceae bacterium]|nr:DegV family protein [Defluviitaleaceae bacterium]